MIYTVFPTDTDELPQDFSSQEEAEEYGNDVFGIGNYEIQPTKGEVV